jgi:hypothetical protein
MELEEDYNREVSSESGTQTGYSVEARYKYQTPKMFGDQIFDNRWQRVHFQESLIGVPPGARYQRKIIEQGLLGYAAAQALRWWLHASAEACDTGSFRLETRLISHKLTHSCSVVAVAVHSHGENRSNCIPEWGKKADD